MERNSGRYNSYNHSRRSGGHQSSPQTSANTNQQHLDSHHHHQTHHHRNAVSNSAVMTSTNASTAYAMHTNNANNTTTMSIAAAYAREPLTQHDELIHYIKEAWTKVSEHGTPVVYRTEMDQQMKNFKPFNLEEYWDTLQNIHLSHGHQ